MTIHADPEILGRRLTSHPPVGPGDDGLSTSEKPGDITCAWCRQALGITDINPKGDKTDDPADEKVATVRSVTVVYAHDGMVESLTVDADEVTIEEGPPTIAFSRDGRLMLGLPLGRVVYWISDDAELDKNVEAAKA